MKKLTMIMVVAGLILAATGAAQAEDVNVCPGNIGNGSLTVTGNNWASSSAWLNPTGYDFATNHHSLDLTTYNGGSPVALEGFVDITGCEVANTSDWSKFYGMFRVADVNSNHFQVTFGNDWLGPWHGIPAQQADRVRLENNFDPLYSQPEEYYFTQGGWTDHTPSTQIFPTDRKYFMQLVIDPTNHTFDLSIYGKGNGGASPPPNSNNSVDYKQWYNINNDPDFNTGPIDVGSNFDFSAVEISSLLYNSTQGPADMTNTISWRCMDIGTPLTFSQTPVPEPGTMCLLGLGALGLIRRRRRK